MSGKIEKAAFIGGGLIGTGLATNAALAGVKTFVQTRSKIDLCKTRIAENLAFLLEKGVIDEEKKAMAESCLVFTTSIEEAATGAQFIQESVPEKMDIKHSMIATIEQYAPADAIISTSTSGLSITKVFSEAAHPERCVGGHPYLPAYLIPLVEITKGEQTSEETAQAAMDFFTMIGKEPVLLNKESVGFIANRLQSVIHREIVDIVMSGICSTEAVDKALVYSVGMRWGIIGQALSLHLGASPDGLSHFCEKYNMKYDVPNARLEACAKWTAFPADWDKILGAGVEEEIAHRPPEMGNDIPSIEKWRDDMLVGYLRLHNKL